MKLIFTIASLGVATAVADLPLEAYLVNPDNNWARKNLEILLSPIDGKSSEDRIIVELQKQNALLKSQNDTLELLAVDQIYCTE